MISKIHSFLLGHKEAVEMYANAVEPLVILAAAVALGFSARAIFLQRQSLQASLFSDTIKKWMMFWTSRYLMKKRVG